MRETVFDKTDKGRDEIATRQYRLQPRLRTLLLLVDGKHSADELLSKLNALGLNEDSLSELLDNGFIQILSAEAAEPVLTQQPLPGAPTGGATREDKKSRFEALYQFYTSTIKSTIGLRGYALQLKVEKAASIDDFRQLRRPYLEAVLKSGGEEMARSLRDRLDQLLNGESAAGGADTGNTVFAAYSGQ